MKTTTDALCASAIQDVTVDRISFSQCDGWRVTPRSIEHESGGFFSIVGSEDIDSGERRLVLYQPQFPIVGCLTTVKEHERLFLLQARTEPGATNPAQLGPTIQASPAAFSGAVGNRTPFIDYFSRTLDGIETISDSAVSDLGERYLGKQKRAIIASYDVDEELPNTFGWIGTGEIPALLGESFTATTDLRSSLAEAPWAATTGTPELTPQSPAVRQSLEHVDWNAIGTILAECAQPTSSRKRVVALNTLDLASFDDDAVSLSPTGPKLSVHAYKISMHGREVRSWNQPLIAPATKGRHVLALRNGTNGIEAFVRSQATWGFDRPLVYPTQSQVAGDTLENSEANALLQGNVTELMAVEECEEGGRFYRSVNDLALVLVDPSSSAGGQGGHWISIGSLKRLLAMPMVCSIQLRSLASLLLALEI